MNSDFCVRAVFMTAIALLVVGEVAGEEARSASSGQTNPVRFAVATTVSDSFHRQTEDATRTIPNQVWETLEQSGWRVQLAEFVVDAAPSLRGVRPRGWPRNLTWENSDAIHLPTSKLLVVAEKRRNSSGEIVSSSRVAGVLRHELGHAFDMAVGGNLQFLSSRADFVRAYHLDVQNLSVDQREIYKYYLQGVRAGWQESFAEAFAVALGGGSSDVDPEDFKMAFPSVVKFVRKVIDEPPDAPRQIRTVSPRRAPVARRQPLRRRGWIRR